jgi:hypothetical protein
VRIKRGLTTRGDGSYNAGSTGEPLAQSSFKINPAAAKRRLKLFVTTANRRPWPACELDHGLR